MKRTLKRVPALLLALALCACLLAGCGGAAGGTASSSAVAYDSMAMTESAPMAMEPGDAGLGWGESEDTALAADPSRKIIYTADHDSQVVVGSADEVLDAGFVIDEDSPEDIMDVFGDMSAEDEE